MQSRLSQTQHVVDDDIELGILLHPSYKCWIIGTDHHTSICGVWDKTQGEDTTLNDNLETQQPHQTGNQLDNPHYVFLSSIKFFQPHPQPFIRLLSGPCLPTVPLTIVEVSWNVYIHERNINRIIKQWRRQSPHQIFLAAKEYLQCQEQYTSN